MNKLGLHSINDWSQLFQTHNWYTFHFIHLYWEYDGIVNTYEFSFAVLGLGFSITYTGEFSDDLKERLKDITY
jgi:hypothetical protein